MSSKILPCKCKSEFQDQQHGAGKRVHNFCRVHPKPSGKGWRCTVCSDTKG